MAAVGTGRPEPAQSEPTRLDSAIPTTSAPAGHQGTEMPINQGASVIDSAMPPRACQRRRSSHSNPIRGDESRSATGSARSSSRLPCAAARAAVPN